MTTALQKPDARKLVEDREAALLRAQMGARLKEARLAAGFRTAKDLAQRIGKKEQTYRNYERGGGITQPVILKLAQAGISINYLYLGLGPKTIPELVHGR